MHIGICKYQINIGHSRSLKSKRRVIKPLIERLRSRFNASVSEVGEQDKWQSCTLGVVLVSSDSRYLQQQLDKINEFIIHSHGEFVVTDHQQEILIA